MDAGWRGRRSVPRPGRLPKAASTVPDGPGPLAPGEVAPPAASAPLAARARSGLKWADLVGALEARDGTALRGLRAWQAAPLQPGKVGPLVVEAEATDDTSAGPYTLTVWATGGKRPLILGNIHFPQTPVERTRP
jgi:hypothetical protein